MQKGYASNSGRFAAALRSRLPWQAAGLLALALLAAGCGGSIFPDARLEPRGNIDAYRRQLEARLLQKYNNMQDYAGVISRVELQLTHPPLQSCDRSEVKVEFCQLVYDKWNRRVPPLEKEYFIITFGSGTPRTVRTDPTVTFGLKTDGEFSEKTPVQSGLMGEFPSLPQLPAAPTPGKDGEGSSSSAAPQDDGIPVVPAEPEAPLPTRVTERQTPSLLQGMAAPSLPGGYRPRAEVHNLPEVAPGPELE